MPASDLAGRLPIRRKMYIQPAFWNQSPGVDGWDILLSGPMPEHIRRALFLQLHIYRNGMSLIGTDLCMIFIEGIALLFIGPDNLLQDFHVDRMSAASVDPADQRLYIRPSVRVQRDPDGLRSVAEDQGNEPARFYLFLTGTLFPHIWSLPPYAPPQTWNCTPSVFCISCPGISKRPG